MEDLVWKQVPKEDAEPDAKEASLKKALADAMLKLESEIANKQVYIDRISALETALEDAIKGWEDCVAYKIRLQKIEIQYLSREKLEDDSESIAKVREVLQQG
jgi:hypothetical protein